MIKDRIRQVFLQQKLNILRVKYRYWNNEMECYMQTRGYKAHKMIEEPKDRIVQESPPNTRTITRYQSFQAVWRIRVSVSYCRIQIRIQTFPPQIRVRTELCWATYLIKRNEKVNKFRLKFNFLSDPNFALFNLVRVGSGSETKGNGDPDPSQQKFHICLNDPVYKIHVR